MKIYAFACPACAHTFRRIFSDPAPDEVACPLCGAAARRAEEAEPPRAAEPGTVGGPVGATRGGRAAAAATCPDSADGDDP